MITMLFCCFIGLSVLGAQEPLQVEAYSLPADTEREALDNARENALEEIARSIFSFVDSRATIQSSIVQQSGETTENTTVYTSQSVIARRMPLSGTRIVERHVEQANEKFIAHVLVEISAEGYDKAKRYLATEKEAFLSYLAFSHKVSGLPRLDFGTSPNGYTDFSTWLADTCITVSLNKTSDTQTQSALADLASWFTKLFRGMLILRANPQGLPSLLIYDAPRYLQGILRALQDSGLFQIRQDYTTILISPHSSASLTTLNTLNAHLKDADSVFITGLERISTGTETLRVGTGTRLNAALVPLGLRTVSYTLPSALNTGEVLDEAGIIAHIKQNRDTFPARYALIVFAETHLESIPYAIRPLIVAHGVLQLYDVASGEHTQSPELSLVYYPTTALQPENIVAESREALRRLFEHPEGLRTLFDSLFRELY